MYNGARWISEAIESTLAQEYKDFELIISDNASTDNTFEICQEYAKKDSRIRLHRNEKNLGAAPNFTKAFELATGKYFKWLAYDDRIEPQLIGESVRILETRPDVALVYPLSKEFDEEGELIREPPELIDVTDDDPSKRYISIINRINGSIFGMMRVEDMKKTKLMKPIPGGDRPFLGEMALIGKTYLIPERWYLQRMTTSARKLRDGPKYILWWSTANTGRYVPRRPAMIKEYLSIVKRSSIPTRKKPALYLKTLWHLSKIRRKTIVQLLRQDKMMPIRELRYLLGSMFSRKRTS